MKEKVIVCGATGNQGSAVIKALVKRSEIEVIGLSRDPSSDKVKKLSDMGARFLQADLLDMASLEQAFAGAKAVFGVTQPWNANYTKCDVRSELQQGHNIIKAVKDQNVGHLVFSSVLSYTDQPIGVGHADSKLTMEKELKDSGLHYTILRCSQFMDNIGSSFFPVKNGVVKGFVSKNTVVPYISCEDIGRLAATILADPASYGGRSIDLIGDMISGTELAKVIGQLKGKPMRYKTVPALLLRLAAPEFYKMRRHFELYGGYPANQPMTEGFKNLKKEFPGLTDIGNFLKVNVLNYS